MKISSRMTVERETVTAVSPQRAAALWRLRLDYMDLRPTVSEEEDFTAFSAFLARKEVTTFIFKKRGSTDDNEIVGFCCVLEVSMDGTHVLGIEYTFFRPGYRDRIATAFLRCSLKAILRLLLGHKTYWGSVAYPQSYTLLRHLTGSQPLTIQTASLTQKKIIDWLGPHLGNYDASLGITSMRTIPKTGAWTRYLAEYEACNPNWREGMGLNIIAPVTFSTAYHVLTAPLKQFARNYWK